MVKNKTTVLTSGIVMLALLMALLFTMFAVRAEETPLVIIENVETGLAVDSEFKMTIKLENNPGITSMKLQLHYDNTAMILTDVAYNPAMGGTGTQPNYSQSAPFLNWTLDLSDYSNDGIFATLTFRILDGAKAGEYPVSVTYDPEDVYNLEEVNVYFRVQNGGVTFLCDHSYSSWESIGGTQHSRVCTVCGGTQTEDHTWDTGMITKPATHMEEGVRTFVCTICGEIKNESIPKTTEHTFGEWTADDDNTHSRECECGEKETAEHTWDDGVITTPATHTEEGVRTYTCEDCGHTKTEAVPKTTEHTFGKWTADDDNTHSRECECGEKETAEHTWDDGVITTPATHTEEGVRTYTCEDCGHTKTESIPKTTEPETSEPETSKPDVSETETSEPDVSEAETSEPDVSEAPSASEEHNSPNTGDANLVVWSIMMIFGVASAAVFYKRKRSSCR